MTSSESLTLPELEQSGRFLPALHLRGEVAEFFPSTEPDKYYVGGAIDETSGWRVFANISPALSPMVTLSLAPAIESGDPMSAKKSWTRFIPIACYVAAVGILILTVWTGLPYFAFVIVLLVGAGLLLQRRGYSERLEQLGASLIEEAKTVRASYPGQYPAYFEEAEYELTRLGLSHFVASLPPK